MIGLDATINTLKTEFDTRLFTDVVGNTYASYGRAFWTKRKGNDVPELQIASSKEYQDCLPNDSIDGHSFFLAEPEIEAINEVDLKATVGIYFAVNLDVLYPSVTERAVEYLHRDVLQILGDSPFEISKIVQGSTAFERFGFVKDSDTLEPFYLVRFDTEVIYNETCTN